MIIMFIALLLMVLSFGAFTLSYQINGMNRLFIYTPLSIVEKCVIVQGDNSLNFYTLKMKVELEKYYDSKIPAYTDDYVINYYFYRPLNHSYCRDNYCKALEVSVEATLNFNYKYTRTIYFEVAKMYE